MKFGLIKGLVNYNAFHSITVTTFKQDTFIQNWRSRLEEFTRATFYKTFAVFQLQPYLDIVNVNKLSHALSRLRVSSHRLEVESGRWVKTCFVFLLMKEKCVNCSVLEDEFHFVLECPLYLDLRKRNISKILLVKTKHVQVF